MAEIKVYVCGSCGRGIESDKTPICGVCLEPMLNSGYRVQPDLEKAENAIHYLEAELAGMAAKCETIRRIYANRVKQLGAACKRYKEQAGKNEKLLDAAKAAFPHMTCSRHCATRDESDHGNFPPGCDCGMIKAAHELYSIIYPVFEDGGK